MKSPEDTTNALPCCQVDEVACHDCRYFGQPFCSSVALKEAQENIRQLEKLINRMLMQMHGDCGVCKHKEAIGAPCAGCLTSRRNRPAWEYEGIPEVKSR